MTEAAQDTTTTAGTAQDGSDAAVFVIPPPEKLPRKRGRPRGQPRTGGRAKGQRNWSTPEIRDALLGKSNAIETLADIAAGRQLLCSGPTGKPMWRVATFSERLRACEMILKKTIPDLAAVEMSGPGGKPLFEAEPETPGNREMARAVFALLGAAGTAAPGSVEQPDADDLQAPGGAAALAALPNSDSDMAGSPPVMALDGAGHGGANHLPAGGKGAPAGPFAPLENGHDAGVAPAIFEDGERIPLGDAGHSIQLRQRAGDGRTRWWVCDAAGQRITAVWGKAEAEAAARQLIAEGRITK